jgi:hypothetical protein
VPPLCGLNITLRHSSAYAYADSAAAAAASGEGGAGSHSGGSHGFFLSRAPAMHVAMILGIAASVVGLSLALAMHLAYRYKNRYFADDDDKPVGGMRQHPLRRSSSSFSRHRRRSSQAHDPTSIETQIIELQETNPIHRMHSRSSSNILTGPILFPPPKPQPLASSNNNRQLHRYFVLQA